VTDKRSLKLGCVAVAIARIADFRTCCGLRGSGQCIFWMRCRIRPWSPRQINFLFSRPPHRLLSPPVSLRELVFANVGGGMANFFDSSTYRSWMLPTRGWTTERPDHSPGHFTNSADNLLSRIVYEQPPWLAGNPVRNWMHHPLNRLHRSRSDLGAVEGMRIPDGQRYHDLMAVPAETFGAWANLQQQVDVTIPARSTASFQVVWISSELPAPT